MDPKQRGIGRFGRLMITASHRASYHLAKWCPKAIPCVCVLGYPRSGTVWASQMVADYLQLPYPMLSYFPIGFPAVLHGHQLVEKQGPPTIYVLRDGRDALTSAYFYFRRSVPGSDLSKAPRHVRRIFRGARDVDDVQANLPAFIESQCTSPISTPQNWAQHAQSALHSDHKNLPILRYEQMKSDCEASLAEAMSVFLEKPANMQRVRESVDRFSFARQSGRQPGQEDSAAIVRKGATGDWVNHFTREAAEVFDHYCGDALIEFGYETDRSWIDRIG
ncbi:sulfotransferase domain-containing protein [Pirellulales bacterium]|nr:sulfotransferase domain-containing protein [Pirellulales bacterium]